MVGSGLGLGVGLGGRCARFRVGARLRAGVGGLVGSNAADSSVEALAQRAPRQRVGVEGGEVARRLEVALLLGIPAPLLPAARRAANRTAFRAARRAARRAAARLQVEAAPHEERAT